MSDSSQSESEKGNSTAWFWVIAVSVGFLIFLYSNKGCDGPAAVPLVPPKFAVEEVKTDHGVLTAVWYVTIRNDGGPGSMVVQKWIGSYEKRSSRTVIHSERIQLGLFQKTTVKIEWSHGGLGAIAQALLYGGSDGIEFLP